MCKENNILLEIPYGTKDFLPHDAALRRDIDGTLSKLFRLWGYDEVVTPVMEYLDTLMMSSKSDMQRHMIKLFDRNNKTLALRHEMTTPIARLAAGRMKNEKLPLRLSYICKVYRYEQAQTGRQCEFYQAGVELMGNALPTGDAEVLALAINSLLGAGLSDFKVCLGQVAFINGLMEQWNLSAAEQDSVREALEKHDLVALAQIANKSSLSDADKKFLQKLPMLCGDESALDEAEKFAHNEKSRAALDNLKKIYKLVSNYGFAQYITFDLGIIRDFSYYTGMVFEIYVPELGSPVCGGGRYDNLLEHFGRKCPATGFALGLERVMLALAHQKKAGLCTDKKDVYVAYAPGHLAEAVKKVTDLRMQEGRQAVLADKPQEYEQAVKYADERKFIKLAYMK